MAAGSPSHPLRVALIKAKPAELPSSLITFISITICSLCARQKPLIGLNIAPQPSVLTMSIIPTGRSSFL